MIEQNCNDMELLIQADLDGELSAAEAARVASHLRTCPSCEKRQKALIDLSAGLRSGLTRYRAPASLHAAIKAQIASTAEPSAGAMLARSVNDNERAASPRTRRFAGWASGAGLGIAATVAVMLMEPGGGGLPDQLVSDHIRALQPGHLIDVISTDQHTVKPWFDGRLDYAPPVKDLKVAGFPLNGGRLDYMAGRPVAALIYGRRLHSIDLYIWPEDKFAVPGEQAGSRNGYNFRKWSQGGMVFWAVSDIGADELANFSTLWKAAK